MATWNLIFDRSSITREGLLGIVQTRMRIHHILSCLLGSCGGYPGRIGPVV